MVTIGLLILLACAGLTLGMALMRQEQESRVAALIAGVQPGAHPSQGLDPREAHPVLSTLKRYMPAAMMASYEERLSQAGRPYGLDAGQLVAIKLIAASLLPALMAVAAILGSGRGALLILPISALAGFLLPDMLLSLRLAERRALVGAELPLFTDLVATAVGAGLPITEAVRRVAADAPGLVAREFLFAVQEMAAGKPRMEAWRDLTDRLPGDELRSIVTAIMQAEQYGTSVAEMLKYQVQQIRLFKEAVRRY